MSTKPIRRRRFLKMAAGITVAGAGSAGIGAGIYVATQTPVPLALIGAGTRGTMLVKTLTRRVYRAYGDVRAVCDADSARAQQVKENHCPQADTYGDYRQVLDRDDIRAVIIATPDHWHAKIAIEALRAGKDVYCEKPLSLTIDEGKQLVRTVKETGRLLLVGTQQRSHRNFQQACELVRNGRLGKLKRISVQVHENPVGGPFPAAAVPATLDWDRWLGPAPWAEHCLERWHESGYHHWHEYAGGEITNWGAHHVDIAHWAMGMDRSGPLTIDGEGELPRIENGYNHPQRFDVEMLYPGGVKLRIISAKRKGILIEGDRGRIFVNRAVLDGKPVDELKHKPLPHDAISFGHQGRYWELGSAKNVHLQHFLDCLLNGCQPISDVVSQHRSATACHLANLCLRLGRKLRWDAKRERILDDAEANRMLARPQREPYRIAA